MERNNYVHYEYIRNIPGEDRIIKFFHSFEKPATLDDARKYIIDNLLLDNDKRAIEWRKRNKIPGIITKYRGVLEKELSMWTITEID